MNKNEFIESVGGDAENLQEHITRLIFLDNLADHTAIYVYEYLNELGVHLTKENYLTYIRDHFIDELLTSAAEFAEQSGDDFNEVEYSDVEVSEDKSYVRSASNENDQPEETESVEITDEFLDEILSILEETEHDENEG